MYIKVPFIAQRFCSTKCVRSKTVKEVCQGVNDFLLNGGRLWGSCTGSYASLLSVI